MKAISKLDKDTLKEITTKGRTVLLFTADWCPDCHFLDPFLPEIENDFSDLNFYNIDRDESMDIAKELNVFGIPSFIVYQNGEEIGRLVNKKRKTKAEVESFLNSLN